MKNFVILKRLSRYVSRYKGRLAVLVLTALVGVAFEVAKPLPIKVVIDNVFGGQPLPPFLQLTSRLSTPPDKQYLLILCIVAIAVTTVGGVIISLIVTRLTIGLSQKLVYDLSVDLYSKLQKLSLSFYSRNKIGDLLQRITGDSFIVYFLVAQITVPAVTSLICLATMFYIMAKIDLLLALIALSVIPLLGIILAYFSKPMNNTTMDQYRKQGELSAFLQQSLSSMKIIQAFARESFMHNKLEKHARDFGNAFQTATLVSTRYNQLTILVTGLASALLIGVGAFRGLSGNLSAGDLYIFLGYITALYGPVNSLSTAIGAAIAVSSRGRRVFDILDSEESLPERPHAKSISKLRGDIQFENVTFGYETEPGKKRTVLSDINFHAATGQIVAIVGPTGAGKTSLISLITRFYDPWQGRILFDGFDLRDLRVHSLRENISLVMQEPFLFPMSIAENIAFGNPHASFEEIREAAHTAQAHDFIMNLPQQYDTIVSEMGASLSGGEKQRIALARAFLKNASIIILDEPTSAMDALTEARIFRNLSRHAANKTIFVITHRLSTIKHADQIITLNNGSVAESGTHESLIKQGSIYADLYKYQHIT